MPNYFDLAGMKKAERLKHVASATKVELVDRLMEACADEYDSCKKDELVKLLMDFTRNGTQGYEEWPIEMLRTELIKTLGEGDE